MRCFACRLPPQIFSKMAKIGFKIPPILVDKFLKVVFKVYRNPWVRTELAETFTIARTFNSLKNVTRRPASIKEIEAGLLVTFLRELKVLAIVKVGGIHKKIDFCESKFKLVFGVCILQRRRN